MADPDQVKLAAQAFIYGYPLVYNLTELAKLPAGTSVLGVASPFNRLTPARQLLGPDATFVTPNNDTLYLIAGCDLRDGPLVLQVPDTGDRYYVLQFVDAWTNNFAYVGTRATGNRPGTFQLTPPGYSGPVPAGATAIEAPTSLLAVVGRVAVDGPDDLDAVHAVQDGFSLAPLDPSTATSTLGVPRPAAGVPDDLLFWEQLRVALAAFPPSPDTDATYLEDAARFGLTATESPFVDADPALAELLVAAAAQGADLIEQLGTTVITPVDGWTSALHAFDYNLDHLGLGTIDSPEWKIADRTTAYITRAIAARLGLWGNHGYEAAYDILWTDEDGDVLTGADRYELVLPSAPPAHAFWSLTMYDSPDYRLVANPIDRYQLGDRSRGLVTASDGTITIHLQAESPGGDREPNWLPTPAGPFRPVLRSYLPDTSILSGTYRLPAVKKVS
ncbi:MAG: DUF1254 domain-containing protein [Acidimicrobiales bacterium]